MYTKKELIIQLILNELLTEKNILPLLGFEPTSSDIQIQHSTNQTEATASRHWNALMQYTNVSNTITLFLKFNF